MITITKEQLIASAHARIEFAEMMLAGELEPIKERTWSIELELARIALASLEAEPVAYIFKHPAGRLFWSLTDESNKGQSDVMPVYSAPVPAFVPPAIEPDYEVIKSILPTANPDEYACCIGADMWNACRAAMLQGAAGNSPVIADGWVACSERMPVENDIVLVVDDGYFVCEAQYREGDFYSAVRGGGEFFETTCRDVELWQPMPAAPQQEV